MSSHYPLKPERVQRIFARHGFSLKPQELSCIIETMAQTELVDTEAERLLEEYCRDSLKGILAIRLEQVEQELAEQQQVSEAAKQTP